MVDCLIPVELDWDLRKDREDREERLEERLDDRLDLGDRGCEEEVCAAIGISRRASPDPREDLLSILEGLRPGIGGNGCWER